uniref:Uncharacterized protein n=1 Tax=Anguilla anguilla TaxID=7936 RepID=A0A0E9UAW7_ANGAN
MSLRARLIQGQFSPVCLLTLSS